MNEGGNRGGKKRNGEGEGNGEGKGIFRPVSPPTKAPLFFLFFFQTESGSREKGKDTFSLLSTIITVKGKEVKEMKLKGRKICDDDQVHDHKELKNEMKWRKENQNDEREKRGKERKK